MKPTPLKPSAVSSGVPAPQRGYILIAFVFSMPFLVGVVGLAVDIGRMYITKNELQSFTDAAALSAAARLDDTAEGIDRARTAATNTPKNWNLGTSPVTSPDVQFGTAAAGPFTATPPTPPTGYNFARVVATANVPMYLMGVLTRGTAATVAAGAVAGRETIDSLPGGEFPFSPYTRKASPDDAADPYGYQIGKQYTLRWGAPGDKTDCGTDATKPNLSENGDMRGYCCAGSASDIRDAIVSANTDPITINDDVPMMIPMNPGSKQTEMTAIAMRVNLDSDTTSTTYADYYSKNLGNGARIVVVPVNGGKATGYRAIGFAGFFLREASYYESLQGGNNSACAEYIGRWVKGGPPGNAPGGDGAYRLRLYR